MLTGRALAENIAAALEITYEELMDAAEGWFAGEQENTRWNDNTVNVGANMSYDNFSAEEWEAFWTYYEEVSGNKIANKSDHPFTCSC